MSTTIPAERVTSSPRSADRRGPRAGSVQWMCSCCRSGAAWPPDCSRWGREYCAGRSTRPTRLYLMSRHFVWLAPLANLLVFLGLGLFLAAVTRLWPRLGGWLSPRLVCALAILPVLLVAGPQIYRDAWFILALGIASRLVPRLERHPAAWRRRLVWSFPGLLGLVLVLAGSVFGGDWLKQRREAGRALPPADSPNVLFIVLDTVRADHLSLYGYHRRTTPTLERLAKRGIRFDGARATAPWTLPSHASLFTGRWPHELDVKWMTPLRGNFPMLAEYLGSHGYATAGFVGNTLYCSYDTGLDRGFTHYEDYVLEKLGPLQTAVLVDKVRRMLFSLDFRYDGHRPILAARIRSSSGSMTVFAEMPNRSIANFSTGLPDGPSRGVPSSCSSITSMPIRRTCCPREPRTASAGCPRPRMKSDSSTIVGATSTS